MTNVYRVSLSVGNLTCRPDQSLSLIHKTLTSVFLCPARFLITEMLSLWQSLHQQPRGN